MSIEGIFPIDNWDFKTGSILASLPEPDKEKLAAHQLVQQYDKGEIIFREGSVPSGIFFIRSGKVKKYKTGSQQREQIIYVADAGEIIGYHAILSGDRYPDSAAALEKSSLAFIPKEDFLRVLETSPGLSRRLLGALSHEFAVLANSISLLAGNSVRERLALQLIVLREKYKGFSSVSATNPVPVTISRSDLASLVGTSKENVVRLLTQLKEDGIIETKGRAITILDVGALITICGYK
jgi:CRP-like cAMP-binding protein